MEQIHDQPNRADSKTRPITRHIEQIKLYLRSGDYSRALDLLRGTAAEFPHNNDDAADNAAELAELEKLAQDGVQRSAEASRLITESQDLFARQNSAEAIQLLRKAYALDKNNSLARAILANALVEHAHSVVETDWLEAETLTNQALNLNPAHPTAKTILSLIVARKETSSAEDWVSKARKLQSSGDLFAALAWVAEGLAVHLHNPKLLQIQDEIQRDQDARRRQARRGDLEDIRRLQHEIDGATEVAAKQALAVRIQTLAAKHWTDGEILSIANALLLRLGLVSQEKSSASPRGKGATVILHVPRPSTQKPSFAATSQIPSISVPPGPVLPSEVLPTQVPPKSTSTGNVRTGIVSPTTVPLRKVSSSIAAPNITPPSTVAPSKDTTSIVPSAKTPTTPPKPQLASIPPPAVTVPAAEPSAPAAKTTSPASQPTRSNSTTLILISAAVIVLVAATFFLTRKHYAAPVAKLPSAASTSAAAVPAAAVSTPAQTTEPSLADSQSSFDPAAGKVAVKVTVNHQPIDTQTTNDQPPAESTHDLGTILVVAGQDGAKVFLNGKLQRQLTQSGRLRLPNLELKDYVVQVSKNGFQDPPQQKIHIRNGEPAQLIFNLQPQPTLASLTIQGGAPGTTVLVDQSQVGTVQPDGTLSVSTINPGDHTVELRRDRDKDKDRFKPRQSKKHFVAGETVSLAAADAALEAASGELKITFALAGATVAIVKGELLKIVSSGVPLNLPAGTYTLTARTAERFTRSSTVEIIAGQSKTLDLSLAPNGMSKWDDPGAWKHEHDKEKDSFIRTGGDFVLYGVVPPSGTLAFSAMPTKGHLLQWVLNYSDPRNYVLFQMDDNNFYRTVIRNGQKMDEIIVPDKGDKKSFRTLQIRVTPTEIIHQIKHGDNWTVLDRWTQPGTNLSLGKFGFYIPGSDQIALSNFAHYADLNTR